MFSEDQLKYIDVELLCEILEIDAEDIVSAFGDRVDDNMEKIAGLLDREGL